MRAFGLHQTLIFFRIYRFASTRACLADWVFCCCEFVVVHYDMQTKVILYLMRTRPKRELLIPSHSHHLLHQNGPHLGDL